MTSQAVLPSCVEIEDDCARSGWVWKQSKHVKKWNRRYFVLWPKEPKGNKGRLLFYYTTPQVCPPPARRTAWREALVTLALDAQDSKPRGLIPLVPQTFTASIERVAPDAQKGTSLSSALIIKLCEKGALDQVTDTYQLADDNEGELQRK